MKKLIVLVLLVLTVNVVYGKNLGKFGNVYNIAEKDFINAVEEQAKKIDWNKKLQEAQREVSKEKIGTNNIPLQVAEKNRSYYVDVTYTLDFDIPKVSKDGKYEGILYKKGYKFNPLDYLNVNEVYVVINGKRKEEIEWVKTELWKYNNVFVMISEGNVFDVMEQIKRPVYFLTPEVKNKFNITKTISVIYAEKRKMRVDEVAILPQDSKKNKGVKYEKHKNK